MKKHLPAIISAVAVTLILQGLAALVMYGSFKENYALHVKDHDETKKMALANNKWITEQIGIKKGREQAREWSRRSQGGFSQTP